MRAKLALADAESEASGEVEAQKCMEMEGRGQRAEGGGELSFAVAPAQELLSHAESSLQAPFLMLVFRLGFPWAGGPVLESMLESRVFQKVGGSSRLELLVKTVLPRVLPSGLGSILESSVWLILI